MSSLQSSEGGSLASSVLLGLELLLPVGRVISEETGESCPSADCGVRIVRRGVSKCRLAVYLNLIHFFEK